MEKLLDLLAVLIPGSEATNEQLIRYRAFNVVFVLATITCFLIIYEWIPGASLTRKIEFENSYTSLREDLKAVQEEALEQSIFTIKERQCLAVKNNNPDAKLLWAQKLSIKELEYLRLTGFNHPTPTCEVL